MYLVFEVMMWFKNMVWIQHNLNWICFTLLALPVCNLVCSEEYIPRSENSANATSLSIRNKEPGCVFASSFYRLEEEWHPILLPLGEMVCVLCTCLPVVKRGRLQIAGSVKCENIREKCTKVTCDEPITEAGECCESCPIGEPILTSSPQLSQLIGGEISEGHMPEAQSDSPYVDQSSIDVHTEFVALLVGRSSITHVKTRTAASARFSLLQNHVTYSFKVTRLLGAMSVWFQEEHGTVLYERDISSVQKDSICGTWSNLPRIYMEYLQENKLFVVLSTEKHPDGEIAGQITFHKSLVKESLSAVLGPSSRDGSGAIAIMNFAPDNSLSFTLLHSGVSHRKYEMSASILFLKKKRKVKIINAVMLPQAKEITGTWRKPRKKDLKSLVRGRLEIAIEIQRITLIKGHVLHKQTCNVLQAILSTTESRNKNNALGGVALFRVTPKGKLDFSVQFSRNQGSSSKVVIEPLNGRRKSKPICSVSIDTSFTDTVSGSCGSVQAQTLQLLYTRQLKVKIVSQHQLLGSITPLVYHEDSFKSGIHILLTSSHLPGSRSSLVGHAWFSISKSCKLHFFIVLDGKHITEDERWTAYMKDLATGEKVKLKGVATNTIRGNAELSKDMLGNIKRGNIQIVIATTQYPTGKIAAQVKIDNRCGRTTRQHSPNGENDDLPLIDEHRSNRPSQKTASHITDYCIVKGPIALKYKTNDVWIPVDGSCTTCNCEKGRVTCHPVECVTPACENPVIITGDCCPQCLDSTFSIRDKCFFDGDKRHHSIGTVFHPYVIPFGYQNCAVCSCSKGKDEVVCARLPCPALQCPQSMAIRKLPGDCCMTCPDEFQDQQLTNPSLLRPKDIIDMRTACEVGGKVYKSGSVWQPKVGPFGTMPCITCQCMNGIPTCTKQTCPELDCSEITQVIEPGDCCHTCQDNRPGRRLLR